MKVVETVVALREAMHDLNAENKKVGFVPTMGALHAGHLSLVKQCVADNEISVVSIFVNPTQFNNKEDLEKYPRTLERDSEFLGTVGVDIVFAPTEKEIYPEPDTRQFDFGQLDKVMEGVHRPGHFNGVAQVVSRLFELVKPTNAYFGGKDFQQLAIIREMVKMLNLEVKIQGMPIVREASGLALSSRNERLSDSEKEIAINISRILKESTAWMKTLSVDETLNRVVSEINAIEGLEVEYYEIVDGLSLQEMSNWTDSEYVVGCITVYCSEVRLIDNIVYKSNL